MGCAHSARDRHNGNGGPTVWRNGRIIGGWDQDADGRVELRLLEDVGRDAKRALQRRADELTKWADGVRVSPRFRPRCRSGMRGAELSADSR